MKTCLDNTYDALAWGSHLPALIACVAASDGPVLELGVGHFSTPALHALCGALGRRLVSVEEDAAWHDALAERFLNGNHAFVRDDYSAALRMLLEERFGTVLIDNSPGGERRASDFAACLPKASYVVVHDYHRENEEMIKPLLGSSLWYATRLYEPPTLVASLTKMIPHSLMPL